jgi:hypothetical protein
MSPWITTRLYARLLGAKHNICWRSHVYTRALSPLAVSNSLRTAGLLLHPSADEPSGWLVLSAFVGLPIALWAYKVRLSGRADDPGDAWISLSRLAVCSA